VSAESTTPASSLPSKQEVLAFQQRWLRRAGFAALAGALLVAAGIILQRVGLHLPDTDSDADQLAFAHAHDARSIYTSVLQGIGFCLFAGPLLFLYRSAQWRSQRVRGAFAALVVLGALAFGVGIAISAVGTAQSADDFVKQEPAVVQQAREQAANAQETAAPPKANGQSTTPTATTAVPTPTATGSTGATGSTTTPANAAPTPKTPDQAASDAREGLADHLNKHNTILIIGGLISTIGVLGLLFAMIYTNLWAMRLGLFTRFWGALGMAFGLFLLIPLFPPVPGLVLWFAVTGLMFTGVWPRPLPPAWAAGEAVPWQRPGDDLGPPPAERGPGGTVEGSGREIAEPPLSENGGGNGEPPQPPYGETQGERRKKRKRRR
jgi:F0F1-type ATP synthase membrane subunit c/vacuolar-type H+-ATPase subunit K